MASHGRPERFFGGQRLIRYRKGDFPGSELYARVALALPPYTDPAGPLLEQVRRGLPQSRSSCWRPHGGRSRSQDARGSRSIVESERRRPVISSRRRTALSLYLAFVGCIDRGSSGPGAAGRPDFSRWQRAVVLQETAAAMERGRDGATITLTL